MNATKTKYLGCCQICEGEFKVPNGYFTSVHGYKRPGHGYIIGRCAGANELPYEVSCELIKSYLVGLKAMLAEEQIKLIALEAREVTYFQETEKNWHSRQFETKEYAIGVTEFYRFGDKVKARTWNKKNLVKMISDDVARLTKRVQDWQPKEVRKVA